MNNFIEMKQKDIKILKEKLWLSNDKKCPVLGKEIPLDKMALDHIHKRNNEEYAEDKGTIRESLDWRANAILGKMENAVKRTGLIYDEDFDMGTFLRNAADYFDRGAYRDEDGNLYIHPNEVKKLPKVSKRNYNIIKKLYEAEEFVPKRKNQKKKPMLEYPKTGKITVGLTEMFEKYDISPYN
jgi:hypothetical protein